jgi:uncharacterized protein (TIGR02118 family)
MIRVLVLYPRVDGKKFDFDYYKNHHMQLVKEKLNPVSVEIDSGVSSNGKASPYIAVSHMVFNSLEHLMAGYSTYAKELNEDKLKFTDIDIITQISEITELNTIALRS